MDYATQQNSKPISSLAFCSEGVFVAVMYGIRNDVKN